MRSKSRFPLRSNVGRPIKVLPFGSRDRSEPMRLVNISDKAKKVGTSFHAELLDLQNPGLHRFGELLPSINDSGSELAFSTGSDTFKRTGFSQGGVEDGLSLSILSKPQKSRSGTFGEILQAGRNLSLTFMIRFERPSLLGGLCLLGNPYLPYSTDRFGQSSSNFGLPREVQLTRAGALDEDYRPVAGQQFLDFEDTLIHQESGFHSGLNFLCLEPTYTQFVFLTCRNLPIFPTVLEFGLDLVGTAQTEANYLIGCDIPQLVFYEHEERMKYQPLTRFGLLSEQYPGEDGRSSRSLFQKSTINHGDKAYGTYSAASLCSEPRTYTVSENGRVRALQETYVSDLLSPGEGVRLTFEQADDEMRCISGIKIQCPFIPEVRFYEDIDSILTQLEDIADHSDSFHPGNLLIPFLEYLKTLNREELETALADYILRLPGNINFCEKIRIDVYEVDPSDGQTATSIDPLGKAANKLASTTITDLRGILQLAFDGLRFDQSSSARTLLIALTNLDDEASRIVVRKIDFHQSINVGITPRPSRYQSVDAITVRLIGPDLLDDYAAFGSKGFSINVDRKLANGRSVTLLSCSSLLDAVTKTGARVLQNTRSRAFEFEKTVVYATSKDQDSTDPYPNPEYVGIFPKEDRPNYTQTGGNAFSQGYAQTEMGPSVFYFDAQGTMHSDFRARSSQEVRSHTEHLFPNADGDWRKAGDYINNARKWVTDDDDEEIADIPPNNVLTANFTQAWGTLTPNRITGLHTLSYSPFSPIDSSMTAIQDNADFSSRLMALIFRNPLESTTYFSDIFNLLASRFGGSAPDDTTVNLLPGLGKNYLNGFNIAPSVSLGVAGVGGSLGTSSAHLWPGVLGNYSFGSQGSILKSATESLNAKSKHKRTDAQNTVSYSETHGGEAKRIIERRAVPNRSTDHIKGNEVIWQGKPRDIVTFTLPVSVRLPALAALDDRGSNEALVIRFGSDLGEEVEVDVAFDVIEEPVWDDF